MWVGLTSAAAVSVEVTVGRVGDQILRVRQREAGIQQRPIIRATPLHRAETKKRPSSEERGG